MNIRLATVLSFSVLLLAPRRAFAAEKAAGNGQKPLPPLFEKCVFPVDKPLPVYLYSICEQLKGAWRPIVSPLILKVITC